ncbi:MAG: phosphatidylserine decarboxylase, partial [Clostridia bacterium]|nr:phosphatidylserine decarboxylase [Clostridia bacterium]
AAGKVLDSRLSRVVVRSAMKNPRFDSDDYVKDKFRSYNDYFTRQIKPEKRRIDMDPNVLISPCDSKLTVYQLNEDSVFCIKGSMYNVEDLLGGAKIAEEFKNGLCLIFRLTVDDYHRYCYFDSGKKGNNHFIKGMLHTVNPVALGRYNIYKRNSREFTVLDTVNFGKAVQVEIGAMMVGKIINHHGPYKFVRGEEKGLFEFGGSTVVLLLKSGVAEIDEDILINSEQNIETVVRMGEKIGVKASPKAE